MGAPQGAVILLETMEPKRSGDSQSAGLPEGRAKPGNQPRTRRRNLIKLGADPDKVKLATRSRKGYWRMSTNSIVQMAMSNQWLEEQGVPNMRTIWIKLHYGPDAQV